MFLQINSKLIVISRSSLHWCELYTDAWTRGSLTAKPRPYIPCLPACGVLLTLTKYLMHTNEPLIAFVYHGGYGYTKIYLLNFVYSGSLVV